MIHLYRISVRTCLFFVLFVLGLTSLTHADAPVRPKGGRAATAVPADQQRYLMYLFTNAGYNNDPNFNWSSIETAISTGCNSVQLCVPWDEIYPTRNSPGNWATLDKQIDRIVQLGAKVALRITLHRDIDRVDTYWTEENGTHTYQNQLLYKNHARQFSAAYQPTVDLANDFVSQVARRYSSRQQRGDIIFMSVTTSPFLELEYSATSAELYKPGETSTVTDYSAPMITGFRAWVASKYTTVAALNAAWGTGYARFADVQPPGLYETTIYAAFVGKRGKDWYIYRQRVHKSLVDLTTQTIKAANGSYKVIIEHGSVFDDYSLYRGTLDFKNYAQNLDGVKVNDSPSFPHRFSMDLVRSNISAGKWAMNEVDGQDYARNGVNLLTDQVTESFQHGAKAVVLANLSDATGFVGIGQQIAQRIRAQGWLDNAIPDFAPVGSIPVKLSKLIEIGYGGLGVQSQWNQIYNQNGKQPVRIPIDEDIFDDVPTTTSPPNSTTTAPTPTPTPVGSLSILAPLVDCSTGLLTFKTAGGDGTAIEYMAVGLKPWSTDPTAIIAPHQRIGITFALRASQSGREVVYNYTTNCGATPPANQPPVLVTPLANQTATIGQVYTLVVPASTFTDPDGQLVKWEAVNLPPGLNFDAATRTISGTPSGIGTFVLTLTVTDNGGATAQTTVTIKVVGTAQPVPPVSLSLLPPTLDCVTGTLTFKTAGGDGTPIEFMVAGLRDWSASSTIILTTQQRAGIPYTLRARQAGNEVSLAYTASCNQPPVLASPVPTQTITQNTVYSFVVPASTFTDIDGTLTTWAFSALPSGLSFDNITRTVSGRPGVVGSTVAQLTVTDNGGATASQSVTFVIISPPSTITLVSPLALLAPGFDCTTGKLIFRSSGGDGTPVEYQAVGIKPWSRDSTGTIEAWLRNGVTFLLQARQSGKSVSLAFVTSCASTPANKPPVLVTPIASQTATLARAYSFVIPTATFSDPDGQVVSWAAANLPVGLTFDATTRTISGTPSLIGPNIVTITVTDNGGATGQTTFILQVLGNNTTPTTPPVLTSFTMVAPAFDCTTGKFVFRSSGGDGTPVEYFAVGIKPWSQDSVGKIDPWQRDGVTFNLQARQSGKMVSYVFKTSCASTPANKTPILVTAIANQTAIVAQAYSFVIPATTFSDPDGQLVSWVTAGLPTGLSFNPVTRTISGIPAATGLSIVTVTATDNGGASVQAAFTLQVINSAPVTVAPTPATFTMLAPGFDCTTGKLIFRSSGGDGTPVEYQAVGIKPWSRDSTGTIEAWLRNGVTFLLQARQSGKSVSLAFVTSCASTPANKPPVLVTPIASQTATLARAYSFVIPTATFSDPDGQVVSWAAANLPVGLTFDATTRTISGTPSLIGPNVITITVTDNGGASAQTTFVLQVLGNNTTPTLTPVSLVLIAPGLDCATGKLVFRTSGGDGTPVEYQAVGIKPWSRDSTGTIEAWLRNGTTFTLQARQSGKVVSSSFTTACGVVTTPTPTTTTPAPTPTITSLQIVSPQSRIVYQRNQANQANVPVIGQAPGNATRAEARLVPVVDGQGNVLDWTNLPLGDSKTFAARLTHTGGWYRLEVRAWNGSTLLGQQTIDRVGIGEVFIIAGQSNAYGGFEVRPGANDDRVSCVDYKDDNLNEAQLPVRFSHMDLSVSAGPNNPKHIWPELGDKLASRLNVPILFLGAAESSTTSDMWRQSAEGGSFPYRRLGATVLHYIARTGARAVLWHQGEGDQGQNAQKYVDNLTVVINKSRQQTGAGTLPWVMSRATYVRGFTDPNIIGAQNRLIAEVPQVFPGPETDGLGSAYRLVDDTHIAGIGGTRFIELWDQSLNADFFNRSAPFSIGSLPQITTGYVLPATLQAGQTMLVPYVVSSNPDATSVFSVQLIRDADGSVVTTLGSGRDNPMAITLPGNLANGLYRAKVVSGNLTALAGEPFRVGPSGGRVATPETKAAWPMWPNPVENELTVAIPATVTTTRLHVVLRTLSGRNQEEAIESTRVENGQLHLTLSALQTGLYFLHIYDGDQPVQTLKVLKK